jgi:proteasome beta subunit
MIPGSSSFADFLASYAPELLPGKGRNVQAGSTAGEEIPHGTTIVALTYAGDRRATAGSMIAVRDVEKVFPADEFSLIGFAGSAGIGVELVRLFQVELEHYEKIEGSVLSVDGKANRLSTLLRGNLGLAMQGLAAVPLFAGWDADLRRGRIFSYDVTGGRYEEQQFHSIGSGSIFARGSIKKLYTDDASADESAAVALQALYDAADDDSATGGPDVFRRIYPIIATASEAGYHRYSDDEVENLVGRMLEGRRRRPLGPTAPALPDAERAEGEGDAR